MLPLAGVIESPQKEVKGRAGPGGWAGAMKVISLATSGPAPGVAVSNDLNGITDGGVPGADEFGGRNGTRWRWRSTFVNHKWRDGIGGRRRSNHGADGRPDSPDTIVDVGWSMTIPCL